MAEQIRIETAITQEPFRCVVCGYRVVNTSLGSKQLIHRREADDPWRVMQLVDEVHSLMQLELTK